MNKPERPNVSHRVNPGGKRVYRLRCPQGHSPLSVRHGKKEKMSARFDLETCRNCPLLEQCSVVPGKRAYYLRYNRKEARLTLRRQEEESETYRDRYRWRAGCEATASHYKSDTGAKRLRVRGMEAVRYAAIFKALGLNILRSGRAIQARMRGNADILAAWAYNFLSKRVYSAIFVDIEAKSIGLS